MNMDIRKLAQLIELAVKKAVKEEMTLFKKQVLTEIRNSGSSSRPTQPQQRPNGKPDLTSVQKNFRQAHAVQRTKVQFQDPFLNEMVGSVQPFSKTELESESYLDQFAPGQEVINLPTTDGGQPIRNIPSAVFEAMNKDYSHLVKKPSGNNAKSAIINRIESFQDESKYVNEQDEDLSWLDGVG